MEEMILSIILGVCIIGLGVFNLIIWKLIKCDSSMIKATLVDTFYLHGKGKYGQRGCIIEYTINNREYRKKIVVKREAQLYNGAIGNEYDVYVLNKHPNVVVGSIDKNFSIFVTSIFLILFGVLFILKEI